MNITPNLHVSVPDARDYLAKIPAPASFRVPTMIDLRPSVEEVEDQLRLGSCTANAGGSDMEIFHERIGKPLDASRIFLYKMERDMQNLHGDTGSQARFICQALAKYGVCQEVTWPYDPALLDTTPSDAAFAEALTYRIARYERIDPLLDLDQLILAIKYHVARGMPVLLTITVMQSMMHLSGPWQTHAFSLDGSETNQMAGIHEVLVIGYDDISGRFLLQNSWGPQWGDGGFFGAKYEYFGKSFPLEYWVVTDAGVPAINAGWRPVLSVNETEIQKCYIAYYGRPADAGGLAYWADQVSRTGSISAVLGAFSAADESARLYAGLQTRDMIRQIYLQAFGREQEQGGWDYWTQMIDSGQVPRGEAMYVIISNARGTDANAVAAKVEAASVFTLDAQNYDGDAACAVARQWLSGVSTPDQVQSAVEQFPLLLI